MLTVIPLSAQPQVNLPTLGDSMSGIITSQQEHDFGRELMRSIRRQTELLDDPIMEDYIRNLTYRLAAHSDLQDMRLEFLLIDSPQLNAFAAPGGIIGVNAGLFLYAENEGQFASVIAHEIAHISQRHFARSNEQARNNTLPTMAALLASIVVGAAAGGDAAAATIMGTQAAALDSRLRYSRSNESEADRIGIRTLYNAGFDPHDMAGMFERMLRASSFSRRPPEFLSTHPLNETRVADSKNRANSLPPITPDYNVEYLLMKQRVSVHYTNDVQSIISQNQRALTQARGQQADAARYGLALGLLKAGRFGEANEALQPLIEREPRRISYVLLRADIAREAGDYDLASTILEENLRINPGNHPLTMSYAGVLEKAGRYGEAAQLLQRHSSNRPNDSQLWYDLAELQGLAGNISQVHQARAEYFFSVGDFGRANEQFRLALSNETDPVAQARIRQRQDSVRQVQQRFYR